MSKKILIAAGGTGGHLFPALQLKELLEGDTVFFAGDKLKNSPFFDQNVPYQEIVSSPSLRKFPLLLKGVWQAIRLIRKFKPDVVVGFGSFHSFPILFAAFLLQKKIILFEPNASLGKVNRFFSFAAAKIAFQFPVKHKKAVYVPLLPWKKRESNPQKYEKDPNLTTILVFGGSQGAKFINQIFPKAAKLLSFPFKVIHLTGKDDSEVKYSAPSIVTAFESEMESLYLTADIVVARCGAGTTAELIRYQKPAVVIPYPYAHGHQKKNAELLKQGARMLFQEDATPERLAEEIEKLRANLKMHKRALSEMDLPKTIDFQEVVRE